MIKDTEVTRKLCIVAPLISFVVIIYAAVFIQSLAGSAQKVLDQAISYSNKWGNST
jgi:hypothetical protein